MSHSSSKFPSPPQIATAKTEAELNAIIAWIALHIEDMRSQGMPVFDGISPLEDKPDGELHTMLTEACSVNPRAVPYVIASELGPEWIPNILCIPTSQAFGSKLSPRGALQVLLEDNFRKLSSDVENALISLYLRMQEYHIPLSDNDLRAVKSCFDLEGIDPAIKDFCRQILWENQQQAMGLFGVKIRSDIMPAVSDAVRRAAQEVLDRVQIFPSRPTRWGPPEESSSASAPPMSSDGSRKKPRPHG